MSLGDPRKTCPHRATEVVFPDGTRVFASASWIYRPEVAADVALYLDETWAPYGQVIEWPDGGIPRDSDEARRLTLGLPKTHDLSRYGYDPFVPCP